MLNKGDNVMHDAAVKTCNMLVENYDRIVEADSTENNMLDKVASVRATLRMMEDNQNPIEAIGHVIGCGQWLQAVQNRMHEMGLHDLETAVSNFCYEGMLKIDNANN